MKIIDVGDRLWAMGYWVFPFFYFPIASRLFAYCLNPIAPAYPQAPIASNIISVMSLTSIFSVTSRVNRLSSNIGDAIGAGSNQHLSPDLDSLFQSEVGEPFPLGSFHPNPASSPSATETILTGNPASPSALNQISSLIPLGARQICHYADPGNRGHDK